MKVASYLSPKTRVKPSGIAGRGLYANVPLVRGEIVSVKGGHLIDRATLERNKAMVNDAVHHRLHSGGINRNRADATSRFGRSRPSAPSGPGRARR